MDTRKEIEELKRILKLLEEEFNSQDLNENPSEVKIFRELRKRKLLRRLELKNQ